MNKITLMPAISRKLGDFVLDGVVGTMFAGNVVKDERIVAESNNQLKGFQFYCYQGVGFNQPRTIVENNVGSMTITVAPSLGTIPTIGDKYYLTKRFGYDDYSSAIDESMRRAKFLNLIPYTATMSLVGTQYEYAVPSGFRYIHELHFVPTGSSDYMIESYYPMDRRAWDIHRNPVGTYTIYLDPRFYNPASNISGMILVNGQRSPIELGTPTANSEVDEDFIIAFSAAILSNRLIDEGNAWLQRYLSFKQESDRLESAIFTYPRASAAAIF